MKTMSKKHTTHKKGNKGKTGKGAQAEGNEKP